MKHTVALKQNHEFRRLYSKGRSAVSPYFVLYCRPNRRSYSRLGITTGVKLGNAVKRNRARRRIRELYRGEEQALLPGYDIVVVARTRVIYGKYADLQRSFRKLTEKLELRRGREAGEALPHRIDPILSEGHIPHAAALLPLYPHLLGLCRGGGGEVRRVEGRLAGPAPGPSVQSLPSAEVHPIRPCPVRGAPTKEFETEAHHQWALCTTSCPLSAGC